METRLTEEEKKILLKIARDTLNVTAAQQPLPKIQINELPTSLQEIGASFVTLTIEGRLRGCIGTLKPYQPLALDVQEHAAAASSEDPRFPRVIPSEVPNIEIEISRLSPTRELEYSDAEDLIRKLRPEVDGVLIRDGIQRATFLPQVWEKVHSPEEFLEHLCLKMGSPPNLWREKHLVVHVYQVEEFRED